MDFLEIKILHNAIDRSINQELAKHNLTYTQATVLKYLQDHQGREICQKDVETNLDLRHPTVSNILKKMQQKNLILIQKSNTDKRYHEIKLTMQYFELMEDMHRNVALILKKAYGDISKERLESTKDVLKEMIKNLQMDDCETLLE